MRKVLKSFSLFFLLLPLYACAAEDAPYQEGEHYVTLPKPVATDDKDKIEVLELFWYGCPHCYVLEPRVNTWVSKMPPDVAFKRMPAVMAKHWENHGRAYYAAELLQVLDSTHQALFDEIHKRRQPVSDQVSLAAFYARHGVDEVMFNSTFNSFAVNSRIQRARVKQREYRATGVPTVIVNGKYRVGSTMKAGSQGLFDVVDYLIKKERNPS